MKSLLTLIILLLVSMVVSSPVYASPTTIRLYVDPSSIIDTNMVAGTTFTVNINVKDVTDLYGFDFWLNYTTAVLTATNVTVGPFFPSNSKVWKKVINDTLGYVRYMVALPLGTPKGGGLNGSGTLAIINFTVDYLGGTILDLCNTLLGDSYAVYMAHDVYDGYFSNVPKPSKLYVDPESIINETMVVGTNFTININIFNVTNLYGFEFFLKYTTAVLTATNVTLGDFFPPNSTVLGKEVNDTLGYVRYNVTMPPDTGKDGNGTLAIINFTVASIDDTPLDLWNTKLLDSNGEWIQHDTMDGYFSNEPVTRDVAITKVETMVATVEVADNITFPTVKLVNKVHVGENVSVAVYVKNNGTVTETFNVTAYYDNTTISTQIVTDLLGGASRTLTFEWSTEGVAVGNYTIWAEAILDEDENPANNKFTKEDEFAVLPRKQQFPIELAAAIVLIAAAAIAVYFIKIRKPKPKPA